MKMLPLMLLLTATLSAEDWPMWRHDAGRTATAAAPIPAIDTLKVSWIRSLPRSQPAYQDVRLQFDAGYEPIVLDQRVFVGSNVDDSVTAFDLKNGKQLWKFFTGGPVRFAPVATGDRVIFGSDDGCVYAVDATTGALVWKYRAVPSRRLVLGSGRLISVWPVRGGPVLKDGLLFFTAGVWPLEGTFVYCLKVETGELIWRNDKAAFRYGSHPHGAEAYGGLAPQGYLLIDGEDLVVPCSQADPARFDWKSGALKEFDLPAVSRKPGGWYVSTPSPQEAEKLKRPGMRELLRDQAVNRKRHEDRDRSDGLPAIRSTIRVGGQEIDCADGLPGVDGEIHSVIAAAGMLVVTTKDGALIALGPTTATITDPLPVTRRDLPTDLLPTKLLPKYGYALFLGQNDAQSIDLLTQETELHVVGIEKDPARVAKFRSRDGGEQVHFIAADPAELELPPYFVNFMLLDESLPLSAEHLRRYFEALRPYGGFMASRSKLLREIAESAELPGASIEMQADGWTIITRKGALEGATNYTGAWAANSDLRVKAPLGLLWYGDSITHFKRSPQPSFIDGVMVSNPKNWVDPSTRSGKIDYRLLKTVFSDVYTGRVLESDEAADLRKTYGTPNLETVEPSQYRPPHQEDWWKPKPPRAGQRTNPLTGEREPRVFPKSYGCDGGVDYGFMYSMRSGTAAFYDKRTESGTVNVSGPRSGCTNSIIPANGVLNLPYFYEGCTCSYPLPLALALVSKPQEFEQWASWGSVPAAQFKGKIRRVGLNFGAPGDRKTEDGTLWLDMPNLGGPSPEVQVATEPPLEKLSFSYQHSLFLADGEGWPWVAGSACKGLRVVTVRGMREGKYALRLTTAADSDGHFDSINLPDGNVGPDGQLRIQIPDHIDRVGGLEIILRQPRP
jgi:hypothetical protein